MRKAVARVAGEAAAYLRDRMGFEELLEVVTVHDGDEGMRADLESENMVVELLASEGVKGIVVSEEQGLRRLGSDPYIVVVDPLDGSKNYAAGVPWCSVSIAVLPADKPVIGEALAAAVAPIAPRLPVVSMARGRGVYEGSGRVEPRDKPSKIVLAYAETVEQARKLFEYVSRLPFIPSIRALGSSSLETVWAALGRTISFTDLRGKLRVYDLAAALAIASEARAKTYVERRVNVLEAKRLGVVAVTRYTYAWEAMKTVIVP